MEAAANNWMENCASKHVLLLTISGQLFFAPKLCSIWSLTCVKEPVEKKLDMKPARGDRVYFLTIKKKFLVSERKERRAAPQKKKKKSSAPSVECLTVVSSFDRAQSIVFLVSRFLLLSFLFFLALVHFQSIRLAAL